MTLDEFKSGGNNVRGADGTFLLHNWGKKGDVQISYSDMGSVMRYFYCAKPSKKEKGESNTHLTVKPILLMQYLVRLITPINGIVLDPFCGSGTTLLAAITEGMQFIGIEIEKESYNQAISRIQQISSQIEIKFN